MRRLAIFSFSVALAALCASCLPLEDWLVPLGAAGLLAAALTGIPL